MPPKEKRKSAYSLALQQVQEKEQQQENSDTMDDGEIPQNGETVENRNTVNNSNTADNGKAAKNRKEAKGSKTAKITIYPTQEQVQKLYDLMEAYRRRTGFRINQQDMIRRLIDVANEDTVLP